MKKQVSALLAMSMLATMALSGCQKEATTTATTAAATTAAAGATTAETVGEATAESTGEKTVVTMWSWFNKNSVIDVFYNSHPDIEVDFVMMGSDADVATKLQMTVASGGEMPDIVAMNHAYLGTLYALDIWEDFSAEPYNVDPDIFVESVLPMIYDQDGRMTSLMEKPSVTGLGYKREMALEYCGTDDPEEMEEIFYSFDAMLEKGIEIREQSGGSVYLFPTLYEPFYLYYLSYIDEEGEYVQNGDELHLEAIRDALEFSLAMAQAGLVDNLDWGSNDMFNSYLQEKHLFGYMPIYQITAKVQAVDPDQTIKWGVMSPPDGGLFHGACVWGIPADAPNKEAAWEWVEWFMISDEGTEALKDLHPTFSSIQARYDEEGFYSNESPWFGGQNTYEKYVELTMSDNIHQTYTVYEITITDQILVALKTISADPSSVDIDALLADMEAQIRAKETSLK